MAQLKISANDVTVYSSYTCTTLLKTTYTDSTHTEVASQTTSTTASTPTTGCVDKVFDFALPDGATVTSAKVCVDEVGNSTFGATYAAINDVSVSCGSAAAVDVTINGGDTSITIPFVFISKAITHNHSALGTGSWGESYWNGNTLINPITADHAATLNFSGIYLLIEYTPAYTPPELLSYTDPDPVAGETCVKAVHMTELHTNVNRLRVAKRLSEYGFLTILPGETLLRTWNADVEEIRAALDEIGEAHESWLALGDNCPRVDVLLQLRRVVAAMAAATAAQEAML